MTTGWTGITHLPADQRAENERPLNHYLPFHPPEWEERVTARARPSARALRSAGWANSQAWTPTEPGWPQAGKDRRPCRKAVYRDSLAVKPIRPRFSVPSHVGSPARNTTAPRVRYGSSYPDPPGEYVRTHQPQGTPAGRIGFKTARHLRRWVPEHEHDHKPIHPHCAGTPRGGSRVPPAWL